ncbi:uncharacterized protein LOC129741315 [Uranotaenia lowii]|uniref:uncharacterized protein LOC129741315 n=1 Tax=Uranotaenia lowii TaxID=190385 RepID=UPI00247A6BAD|nr:uncharacterized protein LOC129741315 [Uranotaenia lowii]
MKISDVVVALKEVEVTPSKILKMTLKKHQNEDHALYVLYFHKENVQLNNLRKIKAVFHCIVQWNYYSNKTKAPAQCRNCQWFGHGSSTCFRQPKCVKCGNSHKTSDCPLTADREGRNVRLPDDQLKCANCDQHHTAYFKDCVKRKEYIEARNLQLHQHKSQRSRLVPFQMQNSAFPQLRGSGGRPAIESPGHRGPSFSSVLQREYQESPVSPP